MKLSLTIDSGGSIDNPAGNAAFAPTEDGHPQFLAEMARCVSVIPDRILQGSYSGVVLDSNGNRVGEWRIS